MNKLRIVWVVSMIAMFGSLFLSEIKGFVPCTLCWYQRILMYPITLLMGVALWRNEKKIIPYIIPMSVLGMGISLTHYLKQKIPTFDKIVQCEAGIPCNVEYINWFGFITIPFLSFAAFTIITVALILACKETKKDA